MKVTRSTGDASFENVKIEENLEIKGSTGKVELKKVSSASLTVTCSTGDVEFEDLSVSGNIDIKTSTGDVKGSLTGGRTFDCQSDTGKITIPEQTIGAPLCKVRTGTGKIKISVKN